jgi:two-component system, NtrC family, sensor kinase
MSFDPVPHAAHTALVVDDDEKMLDALRRALEEEHLTVTATTSPRRALELLEEGVPCVAMFDLEMPDVDGFALCRRMKADPRTAGVPIVVVSGKVDERDIEAGVAAGAIDYVKKPFDRNELRFRIRALVRNHEAQMAQRNAERLLSFISSAATDAIIIIDDRGEIAHWNEAAEATFGYARGEALGVSLHDLIAPARFREAHERAFSHFRSTGQGAAVGKTVELTALRRTGEEFPIELSLASTQSGRQWCAVGFVRDITERKRTDERYRSLFESSRDAIMTIEPPSWRFTSGNPAAVALFGAKDESDFISRAPWEYSPERQPDGTPSADAAKERIESAMRDGSNFFHWDHRRADGIVFKATVLLARVDIAGRGFLQATVRDVSEQARLESELLHARKLEAVGGLAAGIAHEINTPIQYVGDNARFLQDAFASLRRFTDALEQICGADAAAALRKEHDVEYLQTEIPTAIAQSLDGVEKISSIVSAMKEFAHPGSAQRTPFDVNHAVQSTVTVARNEWKYVSMVDLDFGSKLPSVMGYQNEFCQALLNVVVNAAHAIADNVSRSRSPGRIKISTRRDGNEIVVRISDNGTGIQPEVRDRIFDPFFTTKEVGRGTGQGLTVVHNAIVGRHKGRIEVASEVGAGTTFIFRIPFDVPGAVGEEG